MQALSRVKEYAQILSWECVSVKSKDQNQDQRVSSMSAGESVTRSASTRSVREILSKISGCKGWWDQWM